MDRIIYTLVTKGGGEDGRDFNDKGGKIIDASYDKERLTKKVNGWYEIKAEVVDVDAARKEILKKLTPLEKLLLQGVAISTT